MKVYKIISGELWRDAVGSTYMCPMPNDREDGFIHLSKPEQVRGVLSKHFVGVSDLFLLELDSEDLDLTWEKAANDEEYPHLYGKLPTAAVLEVYPIYPDGDGHRIPDVDLD